MNRVLCMIVTQQYPEILEDLQQLEQLQVVDKMEINAVLEDITKLDGSIKLVKTESNRPQVCLEDL